MKKTTIKKEIPLGVKIIAVFYAFVFGIGGIAVLLKFIGLICIRINKKSSLKIFLKTSSLFFLILQGLAFWSFTEFFSNIYKY